MRTHSMRSNNNNNNNNNDNNNHKGKAIVKTEEVEEYDALGYWYNNIEVYRKI